MTTTGSGSVSNSAVCFLQMLCEQKDGSLQILLHGHPSPAMPAPVAPPLRLTAARGGHRTEGGQKLGEEFKSESWIFRMSVCFCAVRVSNGFQMSELATAFASQANHVGNRTIISHVHPLFKTKPFFWSFCRGKSHFNIVSNVISHLFSQKCSRRQSSSRKDDQNIQNRSKKGGGAWGGGWVCITLASFM